jgi:hypothetical protein
LIYTYKRSRFGSYDYKKKKLLYIKGKKQYSYCVSPTFVGTFVKYFPLDKEKYEKKKQEAINQWDKTNNTEKKLLEQRNRLIIECHNQNFFNLKRLSEIIGVSEMQIRRILT